LSGSCRYSSKRLSSSFNCSSVTGIASGLEDNSAQSSTAKANLSAVESFFSSGIVSLIISTRIPNSGPSRNWRKATRSGAQSCLRHSETFRKVHEAIGREYPHETRDFGRDFCIQRSRIPRKRDSDSKVSAKTTKTKKVRRLAAVLLPLPSSVFYPTASFPRQHPGK